MEGQGLLCVSVLAESNAAIHAAAAPVAPLADVIEIRLDGLREPLQATCMSTLAKPVLVTNRPQWEGGLYTGSEAERIDQLVAALHLGARYVDIELRAAAGSRQRVQTEARSVGARVIVSSHDFVGTASTPQLHALLQQMIDSGADIGKIVTTATSPDDALRVLALQEPARAAGLPLCAFAMGVAGTITRLATLRLGGFMTYAALSPEQATAPGQITIHTLRQLLALLEPGHD